MHPNLRGCLYVRLPWDTVAGQRIPVYRYLTDDFLSLVNKQITERATKKILKDSLRGIAELHNHHIIHLGNFSALQIHNGQIQKLNDVQILSPIML